MPLSAPDVAAEGVFTEAGAPPRVVRGMGEASVLDGMGAGMAPDVPCCPGGGGSGSCSFTGGSYHSSIPNAGYFQPCYAESTNFSNFAFQVDMTISSGDEGGIIFRADSVNDKFYLFRINVDGTYDLYLYVNNQGSQAQRLMTGSSGLMQGLNQVNEITVVAQGASLYFYLNKQYLNSTNDGTYAAGKIGVFGESETRATNAAFSNAKVWTL